MPGKIQRSRGRPWGPIPTQARLAIP
jgi:hypothetical protein